MTCRLSYFSKLRSRSTGLLTSGTALYAFCLVPRSILSLAILLGLAASASAQSTPLELVPAVASLDELSSLTPPLHPASLKRVSPKDIAERGVEQTPNRAADLQEEFVPADSQFDEEPAYEFGGAIIWDGSQNFRGGVDTQQFISRYLLDLSLSLDLEALLGVRQTTFFVNFQNHDGRLGDVIVGDFQVFSNIDAPRRTQIPRVWLQSVLLDDQLRIKVGKIDANTEFAYTLSGGSFLNSSMGFSPTIFTMPTYPDPAGGAVMEWSQGESWQTRVGLFDGVGATGVPTGSRLPTTLLDDFDNLFGIAEVDYSWGTQDQGTLGRLAVGGWGHHGKFDRFDGGIKHGTGGWYIAADQWLWNEGSCEQHCQQGIAAFLQFGSANPKVSEAARHFGGGLVWTGPLPTRDNDLLGIGVTEVEFSSLTNVLTAAREVSTEVFYEWSAWENWLFTIDLQYITNPGGFAERREAIVSTARLLRQF